MTTALSRGNKLLLPSLQAAEVIFDFILTLHLTCVFSFYTFCSAQKESTNKANMKRENKAYSYKEQIIEMELQEVMSFTLLVGHLCGPYFKFFLVLQELKKKKGIKEEVQLTSKQKEMMQAQLEKEGAIRKKLQGVCIEAI